MLQNGSLKRERGGKEETEKEGGREREQINERRKKFVKLTFAMVL